MNLGTILTKAAAAGIEVIEKPNGHLQLVGPLLVNYYPWSKKRSAYVKGTNKAFEGCDIDKAISLCFDVPEGLKPTKRKKKSTRQMRRKMLAKQPGCYWCGQVLTLDTSTIDHIIPLSKGGLDCSNNRKLACFDCNQRRGNTMPELNKKPQQNTETV